jgi:hypothetical protein
VNGIPLAVTLTGYPLNNYHLSSQWGRKPTVFSGAIPLPHRRYHGL